LPVCKTRRRTMSETKNKRAAALERACLAAAEKRRKKTEQGGGLAEVCFRLPRNDYLLIQEAAELEHRSAGNFMWHAAVIRAKAIQEKGGAE